MRSIRSLFLVFFFSAATVFAQDGGKPVVCDPHGITQTLCTRCNPKLAPVFKKKGDWCKEHQRPESQCVVCNPDLAKTGAK